MLKYVGYSAEKFNIILEDWEIQNVSNMSSFFTNLGFNSKNNYSIDLSGWNTTNTLNMNNMFSGMQNLTKIYISELWNVSNVETSLGMFSNCYNLVGGNGTVYDENKTDKEYARIDTPETPGYFTLKTTE